MKLQPIIDEIEEIKDFRQVAGALALTDVASALKSAPAAFVVPTSERAEPSRLVGAHDQRVDVTFSIVLAIKAAARTTNIPAEEMDALITEVRDALTDWTHPDMAKATEYGGGKLLAMSGGYLFWEVQFRTGYHLRKVKVAS